MTQIPDFTKITLPAANRPATGGAGLPSTSTPEGIMLPAAAAFDPVADSPIGLLHREMEFEYLAIVVGFVQGLLNWLVAIGLRFVVQRADAANDGHHEISKESRYLFLGMALSTAALVLFLLSFYNQHLDVRGNYFTTVRRLAVL